MPFLWNRGVLHKHVWKCSVCGAEIEFNTREWVYDEIRVHKRHCRGTRRAGLGEAK